MKAFIDAQRGHYVGESIGKVLPIAPSTCYLHAARRVDPRLQSARWHRNTQLKAHIQSVWQENFQVYCVRKVWHALGKQGIKVARCTVARLMQQWGTARPHPRQNSAHDVQRLSVALSARLEQPAISFRASERAVG